MPVSRAQSRYMRDFYEKYVPARTQTMTDPDYCGIVETGADFAGSPETPNPWPEESDYGKRWRLGYDAGKREIVGTIERLSADNAMLREALHDWRNSWLCPVGHFDGQRLLRVTDSVLRLTPIIGEYDD